MLAVGSNDSNPSAGGKVQIHEYDEANRWIHVHTYCMSFHSVKGQACW